jgi:TetR/AcrR family transcriptional repressor of nem operon
MGALGAEVARADDASRETFATRFETYLETFRELSGIEREEALARYATLVGALVIARATAGDPLSDEVLAAARAALLPG